MRLEGLEVKAALPAGFQGEAPHSSPPPQLFLTGRELRSRRRLGRPYLCWARRAGEAATESEARGPSLSPSEPCLTRQSPGPLAPSALSLLQPPSLPPSRREQRQAEHGAQCLHTPRAPGISFSCFDEGHRFSAQLPGQTRYAKAHVQPASRTCTFSWAPAPMPQRPPQPSSSPSPHQSDGFRGRVSPGHSQHQSVHRWSWSVCEASRVKSLGAHQHLKPAETWYTCSQANGVPEPASSWQPPSQRAALHCRTPAGQAGSGLEEFMPTAKASWRPCLGSPAHWTSCPACWLEAWTSCCGPCTPQAVSK